MIEANQEPEIQGFEPYQPKKRTISRKHFTWGGIATLIVICLICAYQFGVSQKTKARMTSPIIEWLAEGSEYGKTKRNSRRKSDERYSVFD